MLDMLLLWSPQSVYEFAACCAPSVSHDFARPVVPQDLLLLWIFCLRCRAGMIERFMVCMSAVLLDMPLPWSPHSVYQFAACCASSMSHGFARSAVLQDLLLLWIFLFALPCGYD